jgi:hypothetical protein
MEVSHEQMKAMVDANQENMDASQEMMEAMLNTAINAMQERMEADPNLKSPSTIVWRTSWYLLTNGTTPSTRNLVPR